MAFQRNFDDPNHLAFNNDILEEDYISDHQDLWRSLDRNTDDNDPNFPKALFKDFQTILLQNESQELHLWLMAERNALMVEYKKLESTGEWKSVLTFRKGLTESLNVSELLDQVLEGKSKKEPELQQAVERVKKRYLLDLTQKKDLSDDSSLEDQIEDMIEEASPRIEESHDKTDFSIQNSILSDDLSLEGQIENMMDEVLPRIKDNKDASDFSTQVMAETDLHEKLKIVRGKLYELKTDDRDDQYILKYADLRVKQASFIDRFESAYFTQYCVDHQKRTEEFNIYSSHSLSLESMDARFDFCLNFLNSMSQKYKLVSPSLAEFAVESNDIKIERKELDELSREIRSEKLQNPSDKSSQEVAASAQLDQEKEVGSALKQNGKTISEEPKASDEGKNKALIGLTSAAIGVMFGALAGSFAVLSGGLAPLLGAIIGVVVGALVATAAAFTMKAATQSSSALAVSTVSTYPPTAEDILPSLDQALKAVDGPNHASGSTVEATTAQDEVGMKEQVADQKSAGTGMGSPS